MTQQLVQPLLKSLEKLPLHTKTLDLLVGKLKGDESKTIIIPLAQLVSNLESSRAEAQRIKALESIIYHTHFVWGSPLPVHLKMFRSYYTDMLMHWPYERHRSILNMEKPRSTSLRYRWEDSSKTVLSMAEYSKNPWFEDNIVSKKLTILQRDLLFHSVFSHYLFLKANPRLCNNGRNLPIPIVEIPMRPLGNDIAVSRIKNLFKSKVAHTYRILAIENPVLSRGNENTLSEIISDASSRKQRRLYQATCKRAYVMEYDDGEHGNELSLPHFRPSSLLLNI